MHKARDELKVAEQKVSKLELEEVAEMGQSEGVTSNGIHAYDTIRM